MWPTRSRGSKPRPSGPTTRTASAGRAAREPVGAATDHVEEQRELTAAAAFAEAVDGDRAAQQRVVVLAGVGHHELAGLSVA